MILLKSLHLGRGLLYNATGRVWNALWRCCPERVRRFCLLASLYVRLTQCHDQDLQRLGRLGQSLELCRDPRALLFPSALAPWIWKNVRPLEQVDIGDSKRFEIFASRLVRKTPCWLLYANHESRLQDIRMLVSYCQGRTATA